MAVSDPESVIQVLSMGMERDKKFPRTIQPMLRHLSKACGMHLLQDVCLYPSLWMELRKWAHSRYTPILWAKIKFKGSHHQCTNITLASKNCLNFWSCAVFWTTWYLVPCQWKGWGRWELLV